VSAVERFYEMVQCGRIYIPFGSLRHAAALNSVTSAVRATMWQSVRRPRLACGLAADVAAPFPVGTEFQGLRGPCSFRAVFGSVPFFPPASLQPLSSRSPAALQPLSSRSPPAPL
jgi:hypothetical protein